MIKKSQSKRKQLPNKDKILNPIILKDELPDEDENKDEDEQDEEKDDEDILDTDLIRFIHKRRG